MTHLITKDEEIREQHGKRLLELSLKSIKQKPQLDELNDEQIQFVNRKIKASAKSWEVWDT